jgi:hypothetical protein
MAREGVNVGANTHELKRHSETQRVDFENERCLG